MANEFSQTSLDRLNTCHPSLQILFQTVVKTYDCSVLQGTRTESEQAADFASGKSKLQWPNSKHNTMPSMAVDVAPYPIDFANTMQFYHFAGYVMAVAEGLGLKIRWGGNWTMDLDLKANQFPDLDHFELVED